ncbi:MAG: DUF4307 domain-containing protein [Nocardioidaceae bacterium]
MTDLAQRYGGPSPLLRPALLTLAVVVAAAGLGWLVWAVWYQSSPAVRSELVAYDIRGQHSVQTTFTVVRRDRSVGASCVLQALAADHSVVGELSVPVGRSQAANATLTEAVRTERRATTVDLLGCTAPGQKRPG